MRIVQSCTAPFCLLHCTIAAYLRSAGPITARLRLQGKTMILTNVLRFLRRWRRYNQSIRELSRLGDRELADIGISRGDIPAVSWTAAQTA
jgi:uncharacterized protein YjiS (DUF1127 family)